MHIVVGLHEHEDHERQDIGHARPVLNCFGEKLFVQYSYCLSQKNGVEACILIHGPLGPCSGTMVRHREMARRFDSYGIHSEKGSEVVAQLNTQNHERKNHIGDHHHGNEGRQS